MTASTSWPEIASTSWPDAAVSITALVVTDVIFKTTLGRYRDD